MVFRRDGVDSVMGAESDFSSPASEHHPVAADHPARARAVSPRSSAWSFAKPAVSIMPPKRIAVGARVAELVDALDLESSGATRGSSSLPFRTILGIDGG